MLPWNTYVIVTDASNTGFGECTGVWTRRDVVRKGRVQERSRFRKCAVPASAHALAQLDEFQQDASGRLIVPPPDSDAGGVWEPAEDFEEIPPNLLRDKDYRLIRRGRWRFTEDIH